MIEFLNIIRYLIIVSNAILYFGGIYSYLLKRYMEVSDTMYTLIICILCIVICVFMALPEIIKSIKNKYGEDNKKALFLGFLVVASIFGIKCVGKYVLQLGIEDYNTTELLSLIILFTLSPIYEEIIFRIAGYHLLSKINVPFGVIMISILYGIWHAPNIVHSSYYGIGYYFLVYFVYSIFVTIMYIKYKENLYFPLYFHYFFNILLVIEMVVCYVMTNTTFLLPW